MTYVLPTSRWTLVARGMMAAIFGIAALAWPALALRTFIFLFGLYACAAGGFALMGAIYAARHHRWWRWMLLEGIAGIATGVVALGKPHLTALTFLYVLAGWIVIAGLAELAIAAYLRGIAGGNWFALGGIMSLLLGLLFFFFPGYGAMAVIWSIGTYAILTGIILLVLSFRMWGWAWMPMDCVTISGPIADNVDRLEDQGLAILVHELRQPLSAIRFGLEVERRLEQSDQATARKMRDLVDHETRHMSQIIDDVMDLCCSEHGTLRLRLAPVDLTAIVNGIVEASRQGLSLSGHRLSVSLPAENVIFLADFSRMEQILTNLLTNAVKYTENGGHIQVTASVCSDRINIRVRDNGRGIDSMLLPRIFDLYQRGPDQKKRGLGLGLALVKSLVEMHGGSITAYSKGLNLGSEFVVSLPISGPAIKADLRSMQSNHNEPSLDDAL